MRTLAINENLLLLLGLTLPENSNLLTKIISFLINFLVLATIYVCNAYPSYLYFRAYKHDVVEATGTGVVIAGELISIGSIVAFALQKKRVGRFFGDLNRLVTDSELMCILKK